MLQHFRNRMTAARNRSEKEKQPAQSRRNRSYDRNSEDTEENTKAQYPYESSSRSTEVPYKSDNTQIMEKSKVTEQQSTSSMSGKSPSDKKA